MLHGAADCFIATPGVVRVFTAFGEASATVGNEAKAKVLAGPTCLVVVVGLASDTPGYSSISFSPVTMNTSPVAVKAVAVGTVSNGGSIVKPVVFHPPRQGMNSDLVVRSSPNSFLPIASTISPVAVKEVSVGSVSNSGSVVAPVVFRPPRPGRKGDLVEILSGFGGGGDFAFHDSTLRSLFSLVLSNRPKSSDLVVVVSFD